MENQVTTNEILEAINHFAEKVDERFDKVDDRFDRLEGRMDNVEGRLNKVEGKMDIIEGRLDRIEANMVTKEYLDDKLADLRGDMVVLTRKEDHKLTALVEILAAKNVITPEESARIISMEPFGKTI
jgi:predicted  nucleic acid-binding Zn-ribbon protein